MPTSPRRRTCLVLLLLFAGLCPSPGVCINFVHHTAVAGRAQATARGAMSRDSCFVILGSSRIWHRSALNGDVCMMATGEQAAEKAEVRPPTGAWRKLGSFEKMLTQTRDGHGPAEEGERTLLTPHVWVRLLVLTDYVVGIVCEVCAWSGTTPTSTSTHSDVWLTCAPRDRIRSQVSMYATWTPHVRHLLCTVIPCFKHADVCRGKATYR